jgi:hypothetical protein
VTVVLLLFRLFLSELFSCKLDSEAYAFLPQYQGMVKWWLQQDKGVDQKFGSFRNQHYLNWRNHWVGFNSQHAQTSSMLAYTALTTVKEQNQQKTQLYGGSAVISIRLVQIKDEALFFSTKPPKKAKIQLLPKTSQQKILLEQTQNGYWQPGQVYLTHTYCQIPFTRHIDLTKEKDPAIQSLIK